MTLYHPAGLDVQTTLVGQSTDQSYDQSLEDLTLHASGGHKPHFAGYSREEPEFRFNSTDIAGVLDLMTEEDLLRDCSAGTVRLLFRAGKNRSTRETPGSSKHMVYSMVSNALWYWDELTVSQRQEVRISTRILASDNGSNPAISQLPDQTIIAPSTTLNLWTLGKVVINGTAVSRVKSANMRNNVNEITDDSEGKTAPDFVGIDTFAPVVQCESTDLKTINAFANGLAVTTFELYLRKRKPGGTNEPDGDSVHIKIAATRGTVHTVSTDGTPASGRFEVRLLEPTAGGQVFTYTKNVAIP